MNYSVLGPNEEYDQFCGKVFLTTKKKFVLHCTLCESKYTNFNNYVEHIQSTHLPEFAEQIDDYAESFDEDEETLCMEEKEVSIALLDKHSSVSVQGKKHQQPRKQTRKRATRKLQEVDTIVNENVEKEIIEVSLPVTTEIEDRSRPVQILPSENGVFACPHCSQRFPLEYTLRAHIKEHDKNRVFKCSICSMLLKSNAMLRQHLTRHEKNKPHKCTECERSFVNPSELKYHMRNHNGEKPYICENCGAGFAYRSTLKMHRKRNHTFEKDYVCPICGQGFYSPRFLRDHMHKHTNEPSYECDKCGKKFNTSGTYARHRAKHRREQDVGDENENSSGAVYENFTPIS